MLGDTYIPTIIPVIIVSSPPWVPKQYMRLTWCNGRSRAKWTFHSILPHSLFPSQCQHQKRNPWNVLNVLKQWFIYQQAHCMNVLTHLNTLERLGQLIFISSYLFIYKSPNQTDEPLKKRSINSVKGAKTFSNLKGESFLEKGKNPMLHFCPSSTLNLLPCSMLQLM